MTMTKRELSQELQTACFLLDEKPTGRFRILDLHAGDHSRHSTSDPTPTPIASMSSANGGKDASTRSQSPKLSRDLNDNMTTGKTTLFDAE